MVKVIALFKACAERALEGIVSKHALASGAAHNLMGRVQIPTADGCAMVPSQATVVMKHLAGSSMLRHVTVRGLAEH